MSIDPELTLASFGIGIVVGLTGVGGGALMRRGTIHLGLVKLWSDSDADGA